MPRPWIVMSEEWLVDSGKEFRLGEVTPRGNPYPGCGLQEGVFLSQGTVKQPWRSPEILRKEAFPVQSLILPTYGSMTRSSMGRSRSMQHPILVSVVFVLLVLFIAGPALGASSVAVTVNRVRPGKGLVRIALVNKVQFHKRQKLKKPLQRGVVKPTDDSIRYQFKDVAPGEYAIQVLQDFDEDGNMTNNWLGLPREPWGMSNNPPVRFSPPKWERAKFTVTDSLEVVKINIDLR